MRNTRFTTWKWIIGRWSSLWGWPILGCELLVSWSVSVSYMEKWWLKVWIHLWLHVACFKVSWNVLASIFFQSCWTWKIDSKSKKTLHNGLLEWKLAIICQCPWAAKTGDQGASAHVTPLLEGQEQSCWWYDAPRNKGWMSWQSPQVRA